MKKNLQFILLLPFWLALQTHAQNLPIAVNDNFIPVVDIWVLTEFTFNLLVNDYDPDGDAIKIKEVQHVGNYQGTFLFNDSSIILELVHYAGLFERVYKYRICKVSDPEKVSNWAYVNVNGVMSLDGPQARNDTLTMSPGYVYELNVLKNDSSLSGDSLFLAQFSGIPISDDSSIFYSVPFYSYKSFYEKIYIIGDTLPWYEGNYDFGKVRFNVENNNFYDSLDINNINARFTCKGNHFWNFSGEPYFSVPKKTGQTALFMNAFWIGGLDEDGMLHLAGERYMSYGYDFRHGPISDTYDPLYDMRWHKVWKLSKQEILFHQHNWWKPDYVCLEEIMSWPGNGNISAGQALILAPFFDKNNNGLYEPLAGDYPLIRGDQALFFIFNDVRESHGETGGRQLGIEVHGMAYAYDAPEDSALWNTVFLHYDIINRSDTTYYNTYLGVFTAFQLGYPWDNFVRCDVQRGMYFGYNGDDFDENGWNDETIGYHDKLPALGVVFLGGPFMDPDGTDKPSGGCDESINGLNFGDGIPDNERHGLTRFIYFPGGGSVQGYPTTASRYYTYLEGLWLDGSPLMYGGNGHPYSGAVGPECHFMWPGDSDPCNWGTGGVVPNGGFNQNGYYWTEETTGNNPSVKHGLGSTGPFTFKPGDVQQLDLAFAFTRDYTGSGNLAPVEILQQRVDSLRKMVIENGLLELPEIMSVQQAVTQKQTFLVYPNPAGSEIRFSLEREDQNTTYRITNISGVSVKSGNLNPDHQQKISIEKLPPGVYFLSVLNHGRVLHSKFVKK
ncbi:MAG: T9SS type A sorting domain-containing protein [Bacteroidales bacterium]